MSNYEKFKEELEKQYDNLFVNDSEYAYSASKTTPKELAEKMTDCLKRGSANKEGIGIKNTCKKFGIKYTYKDIIKFLNE